MYAKKIVREGPKKTSSSSSNDEIMVKIIRMNGVKKNAHNQSNQSNYQFSDTEKYIPALSDIAMALDLVRQTVLRSMQRLA